MTNPMSCHFCRLQNNFFIIKTNCYLWKGKKKRVETESCWQTTGISSNLSVKESLLERLSFTRGERVFMENLFLYLSSFRANAAVCCETPDVEFYNKISSWSCCTHRASVAADIPDCSLCHCVCLETSKSVCHYYEIDYLYIPHPDPLSLQLSFPY